MSEQQNVSLPSTVKPASYHIGQIDKRKAREVQETLEFKRAQLQLEAYHDLRDDVISAVLNSGLSFETIHERCGPHPTTLTKWLDKTVDQPRLGKIRATLRIIGLDLGIVAAKPKIRINGRV